VIPVGYFHGFNRVSKDIFWLNVMFCAFETNDIICVLHVKTVERSLSTSNMCKYRVKIVLRISARLQRMSQ
jgi:hypothetical protein